MDPSLPASLIDAAYFRAKDVYDDASREESLNELAAEFPGAPRSQLEEALERGKRLIDVSCECVEEIRGPRNDFTGVASRDVQAVCPGFSLTVYQDAHGWAMYLTK